MLDRGFVIRDTQGQALRMVGGMADISERKLVAQEEAQVHADLVRVQQRISSLELGLPEVLQHVAQTALDMKGPCWNCSKATDWWPRPWWGSWCAHPAVPCR